MRGGRGKLPVLAEVSGPAPGDDRVWSLRREDFERLADVRDRLQRQRAVLVAGWDDRARALAVALAGAACAGGRRTVLLECDLAQPRLAIDLGLSPLPGLHEYLRWEATPAQILQPLALAGSAASRETEPLVCIAAGRQAADSGTLLGLQSFRHMTAKLRSAYDLVVFSGPTIEPDDGPLGAVAEQADGVLAAISPAQASGRGGRAARAAIGRLAVAPIGAVVIGED
jgi:Mrp family chromosome partitioning ATPase